MFSFVSLWWALFNLGARPARPLEKHAEALKNKENPKCGLHAQAAHSTHKIVSYSTQVMIVMDTQVLWSEILLKNWLQAILN